MESGTDAQISLLRAKKMRSVVTEAVPQISNDSITKFDYVTLHRATLNRATVKRRQFTYCRFNVNALLTPSLVDQPRLNHAYIMFM